MATTLQNGKLPPVLLKETTGGRVLRRTAAESYERTNAVFKLKFGHPLKFNDGWTGYRTLEQQQFLFNKLGYPNAAYPGTSNHGWGLAMDVDLQPYGSAEWKWMNTVGRTYGWTPLNESNLSFEPWHWVYDQTKDKHIPKPTPKPEPEEHKMTVGKSTSVSYPSGKELPIGTVIKGSGKTNWTTLDFDTSSARKLTVVTSADYPRGGQLDIKFSLTGVPEGATVQARVYRVETDSTGDTIDGTKPTNYELIERPGTDGKTSVDFVQTFGAVTPTKPATSVRWRIEAQVVVPKGFTGKVGLSSGRVIPTIY